MFDITNPFFQLALAGSACLLAYAQGFKSGRKQGILESHSRLYSTVEMAILMGGDMLLKSLENAGFIKVDSKSGAIKSFEKNWTNYTLSEHNPFKSIRKKD